MLGLILYALHLYSIVIIISVVLDWIGASPRNALVRIVRDLTDPVFRWIRRVAPFVVLGGIDFSPLVAVLLVQAARRVSVFLLA